MPKKQFNLPDELTFFDGAEHPTGVLLALLVKGEIAGETVFIRKTDAGWDLVDDVPWQTVSLCASDRRFGSLVAVSSAGELAYVSDTIETFDLRSVYDGVFTARRVRLRDGRLLVVGYGGVVFRGDGRTQFTVSRLSEANDDSFIESVDVTAARETYLVGLHGEVWRTDGDRWLSVAMPVNANLHDVCCASDGNVYICGADGTLLIGAGDRWRIVNAPAEIDFWRVVELSGEIWVSSMTHLFRWKPSGLELADVGADLGVAHYYNLSASPTALLIVDERRVLRFDGRGASLVYP